jgi:hypothetical protein
MNGVLPEAMGPRFSSMDTNIYLSIASKMLNYTNKATTVHNNLFGFFSHLDRLFDKIAVVTDYVCQKVGVSIPALLYHQHIDNADTQEALVRASRDKILFKLYESIGNSQWYDQYSCPRTLILDRELDFFWNISLYQVAFARHTIQALEVYGDTTLLPTDDMMSLRSYRFESRSNLIAGFNAFIMEAGAMNIDKLMRSVDEEKVMRKLLSIACWDATPGVGNLPVWATAYYLCRAGGSQACALSYFFDYPDSARLFVQKSHHPVMFRSFDWNPIAVPTLPILMFLTGQTLSDENGLLRFAVLNDKSIFYGDGVGVPKQVTKAKGYVPRGSIANDSSTVQVNALLTSLRGFNF